MSENARSLRSEIEPAKPLRKSGRLANAFKISERDIGRADSLRSTILMLTLNEHYDAAIKELKVYLNAKSEYPQFASRTSRYASHSFDLINAIKTKRSFPGLSSLSTSKQQELQERALEHFDELKRMLLRIEKIDYELRLDDIRSTVWVIQAMFTGAVLVLAVYIVQSLSQGFFHSAHVVFNDYTTRLIDYVFNRFNL